MVDLPDVASTMPDARPPFVPPMIGGGEMGQYVRDTDWSATPLGVYATWPQSLRSSLSLVLNAKGIAALYWGPEQWLLYNDAYGTALGDRHPCAFGRPMPEALPDIAPVLGPQVADVLRTGEGFAIENLAMTMRRHGRDEETVWTYSFSPVQGEDGGFAGVLLLATEMTKQTLMERERDATQVKLADLNRSLERRVEERTQERDRIWQLSGDMLGVADDRGVWLSINPAWTRTLGWEPHEIVGRTSEWIEHPDDIAKTRAEVGRLAAGLTTFEFENRFRTKAGDYRTLSWTAVPEGGLLYCVTRDVTEERERAAALRLFGDIVESASAPICAFDTEFRLIAFNKAHNDEFRRVNGFDTQIGDVFPDLFIPEQRPVMRALMERALSGERFTVTEEFGKPELGRPCWELTYSPIRDEDGRIVGAFHYAQDIGDRLRAQVELEATQEALRQSQKMEAVGQLTGGLAHDFNNLLAGISGSLDMMQTRIGQGRFGDLERYMTGAQGAAKRAAALTHRLLAFSRRQTLEPKPTNVDRLVTSMEDMVRRTVGPEIAVEFHGTSDLWSTLVDPNQLENALLNLCINARDAMPDGGRIAIETANRTINDRSANRRDMPIGEYVSLAVSDTGVGMPPEVVERVFEPFFTTKPIGVGTGLGLSMIYGFANQSGGQVRIHSEVGKGTTVTIFLPRHATAEGAATLAEADTEDRQANAGETVLVIDDEPLVRMLVVDVLEELGYRAIEAGDGPSGLKVLRSDVAIDLLVTDVGLPNGMNGRQVADAARELRPGLKVLFVTGYAETAVLNHGHLDPGMQVVTKPFQMEALARRIQEMIRGR